jgi:CRP-like cAMP-binding protein
MSWIKVNSAFIRLNRFILDYYAGGHYIIREGEKGDTFFVINSGQVRVTQMIDGDPEPREIRILKQGDFFGERALLGEEVSFCNTLPNFYNNYILSNF